MSTLGVAIQDLESWLVAIVPPAGGPQLVQG